MKELQSIFLRSAISEAVDFTHRNIVADSKTVSGQSPAPGTLLSLLLASPALKAYPKEWHDRFLNSFERGETEIPQVNDLGIFTIQEINGFKGVYAFLQDAQHWNWWGVITSTRPKRDDLCEMSTLSHSGAVQLALKYHWLLSGYELNHWYGLLPHTKPVKQTMKRLWGTDFGGTLNATMFQQKLSAELNVSPFWLNTALWEMSRL